MFLVFKKIADRTNVSSTLYFEYLILQCITRQFLKEKKDFGQPISPVDLWGYYIAIHLFGNDVSFFFTFYKLCKTKLKLFLCFPFTNIFLVVKKMFFKLLGICR